LSQRGNHPAEQLKLLHGSIFDIKCFNCDYIEHNNYDDPFHPILDIKSNNDERLAASHNTVQARAAYLDPNVNTTTINYKDMPKYVFLKPLYTIGLNMLTHVQMS